MDAKIYREETAFGGPREPNVLLFTEGNKISDKPAKFRYDIKQKMLFKHMQKIGDRQDG